MKLELPLREMLQIGVILNFRQDCHNAGLSQPTTTLVEGVGEKDKDSFAGVIDILLSLEKVHWRESQWSGSSGASHTWSPQHPYAASECPKVFYNPRCIWDAININLAMFQQAFCDPCI